MSEPATRSTWDTVRKRIAPVAFLLALAFLATRTCSSETATVTMEFDLGAAADQVRGFRVDVFRPGEDSSVLVFERSWSAGGPADRPGFDAQLAPGNYELVFEVTMNTGVRRFSRTVDVTDQANITVNVSRELR